MRSGIFCWRWKEERLCSTASLLLLLGPSQIKLRMSRVQHAPLPAPHFVSRTNPPAHKDECPSESTASTSDSDLPSNADMGQDLEGDHPQAALHRDLADPKWRLRVSPVLKEAVECLTRLLESSRRLVEKELLATDQYRGMLANLDFDHLSSKNVADLLFLVETKLSRFGWDDTKIASLLGDVAKEIGLPDMYSKFLTVRKTYVSRPELDKGMIMIGFFVCGDLFSLKPYSLGCMS